MVVQLISGEERGYWSYVIYIEQEIRANARLAAGGLLSVKRRHEQMLAPNKAVCVKYIIR
jgi:hypothetical protein